MNALHCKGVIYSTQFLTATYNYFSPIRKSHGGIEIAKLLGELEVVVVTVLHLTVEYTDVNMHTS